VLHKAPVTDPSRRSTDEPVPRLPRGKGVLLTGAALFRILMCAGLLAGVLLLRKPCADGVANFMSSFEDDACVPDASAPPGDFVRLTGDMSEDEIRRQLDKAGLITPRDQPRAADAASTPDAGPADASPAR